MSIEPIEPTEPVKQPGILRVSVLLLCAAVLLVAGYVVWSGIAAQHRADVAVATMQQHDKDAASDRAAAAQDRVTAAANQKALLDYVQALAAQQAAENAWLRSHHIPIPERLITVIQTPRIVVRHPRATRHGHARRHHASTSTSSASAGPGKSGSAPGHHKHPRRGHRHR